MQEFDIAKYLREHQLGSYGILNHYVDLKPLKEDVPTPDRQRSIGDDYAECIRNAKTEEEIGFCEDSYFHRTGHPVRENTYEGPEHKLTGNGEGDEFEQAETVSEEAPVDDTRIMDLGGNQIEQGIIRLMDDGFAAEDILELCQMLVNDQYGAKAQGTPY